MIGVRREVSMGSKAVIDKYMSIIMNETLLSLGQIHIFIVGITIGDRLKWIKTGKISNTYMKVITIEFN